MLARSYPSKPVKGLGFGVLRLGFLESPELRRTPEIQRIGERMEVSQAPRQPETVKTLFN